jgi:hypothetical protein
MARTYKKVRYSPSSKENKHTPSTAASSVEQAFKFLEGRWKLVILFHLFGGKMLRFSDLEQAIPAISQKMLIPRQRAEQSSCSHRKFVGMSALKRIRSEPPERLLRGQRAFGAPDLQLTKQ